MNSVLKWLLRLFVGVLALLAVAAMLGWYLVSRSLPDWSGEIETAVSAPVQIMRDANAVPHIRAESEEDAFFALGLVHAQDRLWQMELNRRAAQGRLSALLGGRSVEVDRLAKTLDLYGYAHRAVEAQSPDTQAALRAYADGVNAWIGQVNERALGRGAPEFFVFGADISPWTPTESLAILKTMALRLTDSARNEVRRARALLMLPTERVEDILPDYPLPAEVAPKRPEVDDKDRRASLPALPRDPFMEAFGMGAEAGLAGASNIWAVDGSRSATGKSLMANDPHLWLSAPSLWYLADIQGGDMAAIGGTLPGVPAVLIGRNHQLGWGLTTATIDDQDLFIEEVNPENPDQYRLPDGNWEEFRTRPIRIEIANSAPETGLVRESRHGPVLTHGQLGASTVTPPGHVPALAWTALVDKDTSMTALYELMQAATIEDGIAATEKAIAPAQNVVLADADSIAMVVAGALPRRHPASRSRGRVPSSGTVAENDWQGMRDPSENPRVIRPKSGAVANANNRTTDAAYPDHLGYDWAPPYRIERLRKELTAQSFHSRDSFVALQNDAVSEMARSILPLIARDLWWREGMQQTDDPRRRRALELLADWNGEMDRHGPEPLIFSEWVRMLTSRLAADELGPLFADFAGERPLFIERVFRDVDGASIWCDVTKTPERETCTEMASLALDDALANLARDWGSNIEGWRWGEAHLAVQRHVPFGFLGPLGLIFNITNETSGGNETLLRGQSSGQGETPFRNIHAGGLRIVYDFADLDRSLMMISTGQSGHPFSRYYENLAPLWARGDMIPMSMDDADAMAGSLGLMTLHPRGSR